MPKMKGKSGAKKRFKVTGSGHLKREKAYRSHILTKKTTKRNAIFARPRSWMRPMKRE